MVINLNINYINRGSNLKNIILKVINKSIKIKLLQALVNILKAYNINQITGSNNSYNYYNNGWIHDTSLVDQASLGLILTVGVELVLLELTKLTQLLVTWMHWS